MGRRIRVLVADDHGVVREGLCSLLAGAGFDVVATAQTGREAVELAQALRPDVVLLDIRMPQMDGLQALAVIKASLPATSVLLLTTYTHPQYLERAVAFGAAGYLSKEVDPERIPQAVRAVAEGEFVLEREVLLGALQVHLPDVEGEEGADPGLTDQEKRVLRLIAQGLSNAAIAKTLTVSRNTVKTHIRHIFEKLGVSDRTQAAIWAFRHGLGA